MIKTCITKPHYKMNLQFTYIPVERADFSCNDMIISLMQLKNIYIVFVDGEKFEEETFYEKIESTYDIDSGIIISIFILNSTSLPDTRPLLAYMQKNGLGVPFSQEMENIAIIDGKKIFSMTWTGPI